jgi:hypothetical protein
VFLAAVWEVTVVELFDCSCARFNVMLPGPEKVTVVGLVDGSQASPPAQLQLEKLYPVGMLQAVTVEEPKSVLKNVPPSPTP